MPVLERYQESSTFIASPFVFFHCKTNDRKCNERHDEDILGRIFPLTTIYFLDPADHQSCKEKRDIFINLGFKKL